MDTKISKKDLQKIIDSLGIAYNEGISSDTNKNKNPRLVFWDFLWEPLTASGLEYDTVVTYQVSFFSSTPRHPKLIELKNLLAQKGIFVRIEHEYVEKDKCWHSYFGIDVLENVV